jgi:hypothetical protein
VLLFGVASPVNKPRLATSNGQSLLAVLPDFGVWHGTFPSCQFYFFDTVFIPVV